jgi:hypothetical protein
MAEIDLLSKLSKIEDELRSLKNVIRSKERFLRSAGKWGDLDAEKLKKDIYDAREISSRRRAVF